MAMIVGIGANVFDTLFTLPTFPAEDTKMRAAASTVAGGGPVATGLVAAAKLGSDTAYIGNLSDDSGGTFLKKDFEAYGVSTELAQVLSGYRSFASVLWLCADTATRTCVFDRGDLPPLQLSEPQKEAIRKAQLLMVDGNELEAAAEAAKLARDANTLVLYDAGGRYPGVERLLEQTDILIPSEEFALGHTGCETVEEAAKKLFAAYRPKVVVITRGKAGGILYDGKTVTAYPAFPVEAVDTNGSGDVFHGAFAFGLTKGWDYYRCCVFASAVAALKCTGLGARQSVPTYEATLDFLNDRGAAF